MSTEASGDTPGRDGRPRFLYPVLSVEVDQVDGEFHEEGVDSFAWNNPHPFPTLKAFAAEETFRSLHSTACNFRTARNLRISRNVKDSNLPVGQIRAN